MLDRERVRWALEGLIADLDYDIHKYLECSESDGLNHYPELVEQFIEIYEGAE